MIAILSFHKLSLMIIGLARNSCSLRHFGHMLCRLLSISLVNPLCSIHPLLLLHRCRNLQTPRCGEHHAFGDGPVLRILLLCRFQISFFDFAFHVFHRRRLFFFNGISVFLALIKHLFRRLALTMTASRSLSQVCHTSYQSLDIWSGLVLCQF